MEQNNQPPEAETTIVQDVADLFRACGFEVREEADHQFAVSGSLTSAGLLVEAVLERQPAAPAVDAAKLDDLGKLKALAEAAGGDQWSDDEDVVFGADGGSVCICHANIGAMPNAVYPEHRAAFIARANPAAILRIAALVAQQAAQQAARIEELTADLQGRADTAYCQYIAQLSRDECKGAEYKTQHGKFGFAELKAHQKAAEHLGAHRALSDAAKIATQEGK